MSESVLNGSQGWTLILTFCESALELSRAALSTCGVHPISPEAPQIPPLTHHLTLPSTYHTLHNFEGSFGEHLPQPHTSKHSKEGVCVNLVIPN